MNKKPLLEWQIELMPYYETVFIYGFGICESCSGEALFESVHAKFSDGWWFDEARAMKDQGWVVPRVQVAYCATCASALKLEHDPNAYEI